MVKVIILFVAFSISHLLPCTWAQTRPPQPWARSTFEFTGRGIDKRVIDELRKAREEEKRVIGSLAYADSLLSLFPELSTSLTNLRLSRGQLNQLVKFALDDLEIETGMKSQERLNNLLEILLIGTRIRDPDSLDTNEYLIVSIFQKVVSLLTNSRAHERDQGTAMSPSETFDIGWLFSNKGFYSFTIEELARISAGPLRLAVRLKTKMEQTSQYYFGPNYYVFAMLFDSSPELANVTHPNLVNFEKLWILSKIDPALFLLEASKIYFADSNPKEAPPSNATKADLIYRIIRSTIPFRYNQVGDFLTYVNVARILSMLADPAFIENPEAYYQEQKLIPSSMNLPEFLFLYEIKAGRNEHFHNLSELAAMAREAKLSTIPSKYLY